MPPSATAGRPAARAREAQRSGPSAGAPGWLAVGKAGEIRTTPAPIRRARTRPARPCTAAESQAPRRFNKNDNKLRVAARSGTCSPAPNRRACRPSPEISRTSRRARHSFATRAATSGAAPRSSTAAPFGKRASKGVGSGRRAGSLNSQQPGGMALPARLPILWRMFDDIPANLTRIRARIEAATREAGRAPGSAQLVAVSKANPAAALRAALIAGQRLFGENRVQEAAGKFPELRAEYPQLRLHIIGPLQSNKARDAVRLADVIETLDRPKLALALAEAMQKEGRRPDLLIQVNTGAEPQKAGILPAEADAFITLCRATHALPVTGLMCIPPAEEDPGPHFDMLAELARKHELNTLSMGMSGDFETAIRHGATHVRVGSAIFGARAPL